jgi:ribosome maturation factor RimP
LLTGVEGEAARIRRDDAVPGEENEVLLPIEDMAEAKLVLTEALIAESLRRSKAQQRELQQKREARLDDDQRDASLDDDQSEAPKRDPRSTPHNNGAARQPEHFQSAPANGRRGAQNEGD